MRGGSARAPPGNRCPSGESPGPSVPQRRLGARYRAERTCPRFTCRPYGYPATALRNGVPMNSDRLKAMQAPIKDRYRQQPEAAVVTLSAEGQLGDDLSCSVQTGRALVAAGLHPATGGDGSYACSGDMLLQALAACAGVTMRSVATAIGINASGVVRAEGDLDFRGTLGVDKGAPVGFSDIRLSFELQSDASEEQLATLLRLTERYCVVLQTLANSPRLTATIA